MNPLSNFLHNQIAETLDWQITNFKDFVYYQEGPGLRTWQFSNNGMKVINVTNIVDGILNLSLTNRHINLDTFKKQYSHFMIEEDDIVISSSGNSYCKVARVKRKDLPLMMNTSVIRLRPLDNMVLDRDFLYFFLESQLFKKQIDLLITGAAQPNFGPYHLAQVLLPKPNTLQEQGKIASILLNITNLIQKTNQVIEKLKLLKKELTQKLLLEGIGHSAFKDTELGRIPVEWNIVKLKDICSIRKNTNHDSEIYIGLEHIGQGDNKLVSIGNVKNFTSIKNSFYGGDVLYGKLRPLLNKVYLATHDGYCSTDILPLVPSEFINNNILVLLLSTDRFVNFADSTSSGTKMPRTNWRDIQNFLIPLAPMEEQQSISNIISNIDDLIQKLIYKKTKEQDLKKGLMQQLLTGKIRVKVNS